MRLLRFHSGDKGKNPPTDRPRAIPINFESRDENYQDLCQNSFLFHGVNNFVKIRIASGTCADRTVTGGYD